METRSDIGSGDDWLKRAQQGPAGTREVVVNRGLLDWVGRQVEYHTTQPSPAQWVAIAVVPELPGIEGPSRMIVGSGASEFAAIEALSERLTRLAPIEAATQPSDWFGD